ncbi:MAG: 1,4-alpha-glucan branching protein GlgB [Nevskia sp.]|nr:1,4-alpha-glucan branching protein GlgB [Nevskia sp.]
MTQHPNGYRDLPQQARLLAQARHPDPFAVLGRQPLGEGRVEVRAFLPQAQSVTLGRDGPAFQRVPHTDLFVLAGRAEEIPPRYELAWTGKDGGRRVGHDPYAFGPQLSDYDMHLFAQGVHWHAWRWLGAHPRVVDEVAGVLFAVWAPSAERVSVVGDFNGWDGRCHPMRRRPSGVWELFVPELAAGALYKYEIRARDGHILLKADPYARRMEPPPRTASMVEPENAYAWGDGEWMEARRRRDWLRAPLAAYEAHLGSWQRNADGGWLNYRELVERLVAYVRELGFTHLELLPVMEHPFGGSWGYQTLGYFAPTARYGTPDDFRGFVDHCHRHGIGVLLDWTPAHFPNDAHGLARFDGGPVYEHPDPQRAVHPDWGTLTYDYGRPEVRNFLLASALYWLEEFHIDGLRVDAVASMLYLDYSRKPGEWRPNRYGGRENLEAIEFLQHLNAVVHERHPGAVVIAEESTAWPLVTRPTWVGGLGFSMKWNMGWMHDTLDYLAHDPVHRSYHHDRLTFGMLYAHTENFVLPLSHDEVVHGKRALVEKFPGDDWQRFATLRLLYLYQWTYPGKKLLFMGGEFAVRREWDHDRALDWELLQYPPHRGVARLVGDLNRLYCAWPALHAREFEPSGFEWIDCHDAAQSVVSYLRRDDERFVVVVLNFTPVPRYGYRIGVPQAGTYRERLNTDAAVYGGGNVGNLGAVRAEAREWMGRSHSLSLTLPPLGGIVLVPDQDER